MKVEHVTRVKCITFEEADGNLLAIDRLQKLIDQQGRLMGFDPSTHIEAERISIVLDR